MPKSGKRSKQRRPVNSATRADRHRLYELSVQCPESEVDFLVKEFKRLRGRPADLLREDFCGTASVCAEWVSRKKSHRAIGVDLDAAVLEWGRTHNLATLKPARRARVQLLNADVLKVQTEPADIIAAMNFSYWLLRDRATLLHYFQRVCSALADDGVFFLDAYGGYDSFREIVEEREIDDGGEGFTYIWDQAHFEPLTNELTCHIHFAFPDGSRMDKAFSYQWRLWTLPEIRELLTEAGFKDIQVYWQGWDKDGEPDGDFKPTDSGTADAGWIAYLTAQPS